MTTEVRWATKRLGDLAEFRNGVNYNKSSFGVGMKVIGVSDFQDYTKPRYGELEEINPKGIVTERNILRDGDIVFVRSNGNRELIGRSLFIEKPPEEVTHSAFTIRLRFSNNDVVSRFYAYCFRTQAVRQMLAAYGGGTNISNLNQEILSSLEVPYPSLNVQHKIASILSAYDDLIENNTRRIKILEEMAQTIYNEWFVKFRFPGHEKVKMVDSELGMIPEGWVVRKLSETCAIVMGQSPKSEYYNSIGEGLPFHQGVTDFGNRFPIDTNYCTKPQRIAEAGDILFSVRAPVGRINVTTKKIVIGRGLCAIRNNGSYQNFTFHQLKDKFQEEDSMGGGTIFKAVTKSDMYGIKLITPPKTLIQMFESIIVPVSSEIKILTDKNINLCTTRDLLLPHLISGEVDVSTLDINVEEITA